jgi:hypothetical protein
MNALAQRILTLGGKLLIYLIEYEPTHKHYFHAYIADKACETENFTTSSCIRNCLDEYVIHNLFRLHTMHTPSAFALVSPALLFMYSQLPAYAPAFTFTLHPLTSHSFCPTLYIPSTTQSLIMAHTPRVNYVVRLPAATIEVLREQCAATHQSLSDALRACIRTALKSQPLLAPRPSRTRAEALAEKTQPVCFRMDATLAGAVQACALASDPLRPLSLGESVRQLVELGMDNPEAVTDTARHSCLHTFIGGLRATTRDEFVTAAAAHGATLERFVTDLMDAYADELYALRLSASSRAPHDSSDNLFG